MAGGLKINVGEKTNKERGSCRPSIKLEEKGSKTKQKLVNINKNLKIKKKINLKIFIPLKGRWMAFGET